MLHLHRNIPNADTKFSSSYNFAVFLLETLSEDYYRYLNETAEYSMLEELPVGEPSPIHTNIQGGLGIVGSYSSSACNSDTIYMFKQKDDK